MKKLYRSKNDRNICGVCGGIAEYFNIDSTLVRIIWVIVSIFSASVPGLLIYIICALIIPEEPDSFDTTAQYNETDGTGSENYDNNNTDFYYKENK